MTEWFMGHGGNRSLLAQRNGCSEDDVLDFSASINPMGLPGWSSSLFKSKLKILEHYPDPNYVRLKAAIAKTHGVDPKTIVVGNGTSEILFALMRLFRGRRAVIPVPCYIDYAKACKKASMQIERFYLKAENEFELETTKLSNLLKSGDVLLLAHPNNPTGKPILFDSIVELICSFPSVTFVVDEAFIDFVKEAKSFLHNRLPNVIVLRSLTKFYAIPGLRLGYIVGDSTMMADLKPELPPWSVNALAEEFGLHCFEDKVYANETREYVERQRKFLVSGLKDLGIKVFSGAANFILCQYRSTVALGEHLMGRNILIRLCNNFEGLDENYFRVAVRLESENRQLLQAISEVTTNRRVQPQKKKKPAIMFQGTGSNVGKSILAAAFCRILYQDGYDVAPFKSQNMALNSFVTLSGKEMARAQVVQAQACRMEPDHRMNPVLIKPNSVSNSQIVVCGDPIGTMSYEAFIKIKPKVFEQVQECYDSLLAEHEVIVLEGAGSPAEINLKHHDIVNMKMAQYAEANVILVGDIDRGGVFASFVGTLEVLSEWERELISGFIINQFRGSASLLSDGIQFLERTTNKKNFGVVPYVRNLNIPEEDSVQFKKGLFDDSPATTEGIEVVVIDLPRISNFTDVDALRMEDDVYLRIVRSPYDLGDPDAIIIPGSKSVISDIDYLQTSGLSNAIRNRAASGIEVIGLCGGYQMLGTLIRDPLKLESGRTEIEGLSLLGLTTVLAPDKTKESIRATHLDSHHPVFGYEIHHGRTQFGDSNTPIPLFRRTDGEIIGSKSKEGRIWGTYLHGVFDADVFRRWFINKLRVRKGLGRENSGKTFDIEPSLEKLAAVVRQHLNVKKIYQQMKI